MEQRHPLPHLGGAHFPPPQASTSWQKKAGSDGPAASGLIGGGVASWVEELSGALGVSLGLLPSQREAHTDIKGLIYIPAFSIVSLGLVT